MIFFSLRNGVHLTERVLNNNITYGYCYYQAVCYDYADDCTMLITTKGQYVPYVIELFIHYTRILHLGKQCGEIVNSTNGVSCVKKTMSLELHTLTLAMRKKWFYERTWTYLKKAIAHKKYTRLECYKTTTGMFTCPPEKEYTEAIIKQNNNAELTIALRNSLRCLTLLKKCLNCSMKMGNSRHMGTCYQHNVHIRETKSFILGAITVFSFEIHQ